VPESCDASGRRRVEVDAGDCSGLQWPAVATELCVERQDAERCGRVDHVIMVWAAVFLSLYVRKRRHFWLKQASCATCLEAPWEANC
jgi:hypothetical protein